MIKQTHFTMLGTLILVASLFGIQTASFSTVDVDQLIHPENIEPEEIRYFAYYNPHTMQFEQEITPLQYTGFENTGVTEDGQTLIHDPTYALFYDCGKPYGYEKRYFVRKPGLSYNYIEQYYFDFEFSLTKKIRRYEGGNAPQGYRGYAAESHQYYDEDERVRYMQLFVTYEREGQPVLLLNRDYASGFGASSTYYGNLREVQWMIDILNEFAQPVSTPFEQIIEASQNVAPQNTTTHWYLRAEIDPIDCFHVKLIAEQPAPPSDPYSLLYKVTKDAAGNVLQIEQMNPHISAGWELEYYDDTRLKAIHYSRNHSYQYTTQLFYDYHNRLSHAETYSRYGEKTGRWYRFHNNQAVQITEYVNGQLLDQYDIFTGIEPSEYRFDPILRMIPDEVKHYVEYRRSINALHHEVDQHTFDYYEHPESYSGMDEYGFHKWVGYFRRGVMYALEEFGGQEHLDVRRIEFMDNEEGLHDLYFIREILLTDAISNSDHQMYGKNIGAIVLSYTSEADELIKREIYFFHNNLEHFELPIHPLPGALGIEIFYDALGNITNFIPHREALLGKAAMLRLIHFFPYNCRASVREYIIQTNL